MANVEVSGLRGFSRRSARLKGYASRAHLTQLVGKLSYHGLNAFAIG